jgi:hypothetical protein
MTFVKGQSGNPAGRAPGSKNKISEKFISALTADFEQHGETVIERVRAEKPEQYLKIVSDLVPKDFNIEGNLGLTVTIRKFTIDEYQSAERVASPQVPDESVELP